MKGRPSLIAAVILALALMAAFGPDLIKGIFIFGRIIEDPNNLFSFYPWNIFSSEVYHSGRFPLFNPFNGCGVPHLANYQTAALYPFHLLLYIHPSQLAFDLFLITRLFTIGYGAYFLARRLGYSNMAAIGAMLAAAFNGFFMRYMSMVHLNVEALLPWTLLFALKAHEEKRFRDFALLAGFVAAGILGGNAESAFFLMAITALWAIWLGINEKGAGWMLTMAAIALASLPAAAQTLPFLEYLPHAWHIHESGAGGQWLDMRGLVGLVAPNIFGQALGFAPYAGAVVLMLALIGSGRDRRSCFFFILAIFIFILIYGPPGTRWITRLPGLSRIASYKYAFAPLGVMLAMLAGRGMDAIERGEIASGLARRTAISIAIFIGFFIAGASITGTDINVLSPAFAILALVAAGFAISLKRFRPAAIVAILWVELMFNFFGLAPKTILNPDQLRSSSQISYIIENRQAGRMAASVQSGLLPDLNLLWWINDVGLFDALYPKAYVGRIAEALAFKYDEATSYFKSHAYSFPISPESVISQVWRDMGVRFYVGRDLNPSGLVTSQPHLWEDYDSLPLMEVDSETLDPIWTDDWRYLFGEDAYPRTLIARYNHLPGWRAWVNGAEARLEWYDGIFMKLTIPREGGAVRISYVPWGWKTGLWSLIASLLSLTSWAGVNILMVRREKSEKI